MKTIILTIIIFLTACAGDNANIMDQAEIAGLVSPVPDVSPTNTIVESPDSSIEPVETIKPTADQESMPATATQTPEQPAQDVESPVEPYPAPILTAEPPPGYPPLSKRETKPTTEPYPPQENDQEEVPVYEYQIINEYPHDPQAFTQGLVVTNKGQEFIEGTGLWGQSSLRRVNIESGEVTQFHELPDQVFGEGLTTFEGEIYQLTWKSNMGFIYDSQSFEQIGEFEYAHEGWGITHDGQELIVSDGTSTIYFWDAQTLQETRQIQVVGPDGPVTRLNELEYYNGEILANIWQTDLIARISPKDGQVLGWIDLTGLYDPGVNADPDDVLNGIAYDEREDRLYVTGKRWPVLFEIELVESPQ